MVTRKEIREAWKKLSGLEETVRQKTLQILRNTPNKEQAASMIARQIFIVVRHEIEPLRNLMLQFRDEALAKEKALVKEREELERKAKAELARIDKDTEAKLARLEEETEDKSGDEWKNGGGSEEHEA